jgi:beta-galactosidase
VSTRGIYANDPERGYMSAYDDNKQAWSNTAEEWMSFFAPRPWLSGGFVWTGFDYRGEPTPYGWPCVNSHFGVLDTCGFPKDNFYYYLAWWTPQPVLHLLPHWNWAGREGQEIDVRALSNCEEVELFLNGKGLGRQAMKRYSELKWKVPYAAGVLSAKGFNRGAQVAETRVETTGAASALVLRPDRAVINADGEDVSVVAVSVVDAAGRVVPTALDKVSFELSGPGRIIGVGNGDPSSHEPDTFIAVPAAQARPVEGWRMANVADANAANLPEVAEKVDDAAWKPVEVNTGGVLGRNEHAVYRTTLRVTAEELAADGIELELGKFAGEGNVWVNGRNVGRGGDPRVPSTYDVKALLHPGDNVVAVAMMTWTGDGGLAGGATLRFTGAPEPVRWSRSVFNGLAQVIVQSTETPGTIELTARADGLKPSIISIKPASTTPRVSVP